MFMYYVHAYMCTLNESPVIFLYLVEAMCTLSLLACMCLQAGSLYNEGMQPVMYSTMEAMETGVGWRRRGHNIKYFKTPLRRYMYVTYTIN